MAVHYRPGVGVVCYHFWPLKVLTPAWLDDAAARGGRFARVLDRRLCLLGLVRHVSVLGEDAD